MSDQGVYCGQAEEAGKVKITSDHVAASGAHDASSPQDKADSSNSDVITKEAASKGRPSVTVGTDCSGMGTPMLGLRAMGIPQEHKFSYDIVLHVRRHLSANVDACTRIYSDLFKRDVASTPTVHVYIAGFPCQLFSTAGNKQGFRDSRGGVF